MPRSSSLSLLIPIKAGREQAAQVMVIAHKEVAMLVVVFVIAMFATFAAVVGFTQFRLRGIQAPGAQRFK
jgi:hypothetical protein